MAGMQMSSCHTAIVSTTLDVFRSVVHHHPELRSSAEYATRGDRLDDGCERTSHCAWGKDLAVDLRQRIRAADLWPEASPWAARWSHGTLIAATAEIMD